MVYNQKWQDHWLSVLLFLDQCIIKTTGGNSPAGSKCYFPFVDDDGVTQNETCAVRANGITRYCYTNAEGTVWAECETETCLDRGRLIFS